MKTTEQKSPAHSHAKADQVSSDMRKPTTQAPTPSPPLTESKNVLQLRLQQRRTREQLADQGIMPPLKSPAAFHEQKKSLERFKTGDYLKHKIRSRPEKSDLVNMHILQDSASEGSAQDAQMKLKRARLADDLNEKIALRPGPLELVKKNIIPVHSTIKEAAMKVNHGKFPKQDDSYAFEEDSSSDSLSPEQPLSDESQGSSCPLAETKGSVSPSPGLTSTGQGSHNRDTTNQSQDDGVPVTNCQATPPIPVPEIVKSKASSDKNRHKKPKDVKPKVKKLKYHQYIPPDQKVEKSPPPMDSAYARLLQQQQLFLQLQILSQQKHQHHAQPPPPPRQQPQSFSYQPLHQQAPAKPSNEQITACNSSAPSSTVSSSSSSPVKTTYCNPSSVTPVRPGPLPPNLDDLKVSELRQQLRIRGLPVSGTKTALIERLRPFKDPGAGSPTGPGDVATVTFPATPTGSLSSYQSPSSSMSHGGYYPFCSTGSTPPISPASSDLSVGGSLPDNFSDVTMPSPQFGPQVSPAPPSADEGGAVAAEGPDAEKDKMLVEKQKVIEELTWKLHQEQRQVEELRMQLHKRKRAHGGPPEPRGHLQPPLPPGPARHFFGVAIKQEHVASSCPLSSRQLKGGCMEALGHRGLEAAPCGSPSGLSAFLSPQCSPQDSPVTKTSGSPQPSSPSNPYLLSPPLGRDVCPHPLPQSGARPRTMQLQQKNVGQSVSCSYPADQRGLQPVYSSSADSSLNQRGSSKAKSANMQHKMPILHCPGHVGQKCPTSSTAFRSSDCAASETKRPPRYEDAVKQQLTRSQQMDELLDVLIESGEMPANAKEERPSVTKVVPHLTVSPGSTSGAAIPKFHRHYSHMSPGGPLPYEHAAGHGDCHLEALLSGPMGRPGDIVLLKMGADEGPPEEGGEGFAGGCRRDDRLLGGRDAMDTPLSPMATKASPAADGQGLGMAFAESPWETMEWLDLTPPSSATAFSSMPPAGPSIFNTEFLDVTDINLNSAMDLHLEHW